MPVDNYEKAKRDSSFKMRNTEQIRERIQLAIIEEMQSSNLLKEPENFLPKFIESLSAKITEITIDEIEIRRRY